MIPTTEEARRSVSPAYAGIDLSLPPLRSRGPRFPRIRGDRPSDIVVELKGRRFPPHTRGSTHQEIRDIVGERVSPAYAGIDLSLRLGRSSASSFPRIRGDRPAPGVPRFGGAWFPPHTRGSTGRGGQILRRQPVSPAYAGIDRYALYRRAIQARFPRIRGDRPLTCAGTRRWSGFPPHTRGSTWGELESLQRAKVSPAYAGIDPAQSTAADTTASFPRIRGDRPACWPGAPTPSGFPPHTRGSTCAPHKRTPPDEVSPAYAGIDPSPSAVA